MLNVKVQILEGVNIYGEKPVIKLKAKDIDTLQHILYKYKHIEKEFNLQSEVKEFEYEKYSEIIIYSNEIYLSVVIIQWILKEEDKKSIVAEIKRRISLDWASDIKKKLEQEGIPYFYVSDDEIQIGYGINSSIIKKEACNSSYKKIIDSIKMKNNGVIPIISVTGTNGKTTTVRLIHNILLMLGYNTGLSSTGGIFINKNNIRIGDTTGFYSAREVLKDNSVEVAVLETARGGILKKGLGYQKAKVAVITSLSEDHIGLEGVNTLEDLVEVKAVISDELAEDGILVVKATKELVYKFKNRDNLILFDDYKSYFIEEHIKKGGRSFFVENTNIIENNKGVEKKIISVKELKFTFNGASKSNVRNIISALIAVEHIHKNLDDIVKVIKELECNIYTNLGRQNIIDFNKFKLLIDYGHNSESFFEVFSIAKSLCQNRIIAIITAPGDRGDKYIEELGEIAGKFSDYIIIKEQPDLRARSVGETAELLKQGVLKGGFKSENIKVILDEESAILEGLNLAKEGDIVVSFSQFLYLTMPVINEFRIKNNMDIIGKKVELRH